MGWHWRDPQTFPYAFHEGVFESTASPDESFILLTSLSKSDLKAKAELFRWFKWCVTSQPEHSLTLAKLLEVYDLRTSLRPDKFGGFILFLTARRKKLHSLLDLNPELADLISPECQ